MLLGGDVPGVVSRNGCVALMPVGGPVGLTANTGSFIGFPGRAPPNNSKLSSAGITTERDHVCGQVRPLTGKMPLAAPWRTLKCAQPKPRTSHAPLHRPAGSNPPAPSGCTAD